MIEPPDNPAAEAAAAVLKGAVSAVPIVGGVVAEVGNLYLNPLEKRKQRWVTEVTSAINEINNRFSILPGQLQENDQFISFLYHATILALKNHQQSKIDALRNAVVSSVDPKGLDEDLKLQFLRYVDELSVTHLSMLACLDKHAGQFARMNKLEQVHFKLQSYMGASLDRVAFRSFLHDLDSRFLVQLGDLEELPEYASKQSYLLLEESKERQIGVTSLGQAFLSFIRYAAP